MNPEKDPLYRLDLCYIGTQFLGWQAQPNKQSVQDRLEHALSTILRHPVRVTGASRTDTGVHAEHQVATFRSAANIDCGKVLRSLSGILPRDVGVLALQPVAAGSSFHPIVDCEGKAYRYRIWRGSQRHPFWQDFSWHIHQPLDVDRMREEAKALVGTHDFTSFCAADSSAKTKVRTLFECVVEERGAFLNIWFIGDGFLKQMVRALVGTLVEYGTGKRTQPGMEVLLTAGDRTITGQTAPALGLSLVRLFYDEILTYRQLSYASEAGYSLPCP